MIEELSVSPAGDAEDSARSQAELRFQVGSISKLVVAAVVLRLVELQVLRLDEAISRWVRDPPASWDGINLHQLIGQTSGIGHWDDVPGLPKTFLTDPPPRDELVAMIAAAPLVTAPGRTWRYSGPGFLVASLVVEAATGADYGDVATQLVFTPAQLGATTSGQFPSTFDDVALGHRRGEPVPLARGFTHLPGTGDVWSNAEDLVTLNRALRAGVVLSKETADQLWRPRAMSIGPGGDRAVVTRHYGYGTFLGQVKGLQARINPGDNPGYQSLLAYLPDLDIDLAILCNDEAPSVDAALGSLHSI